MIDISHLERCTCKVLDPGGAATGTAFFVSPTRLITGRHVVEGFLGESFLVETFDKKRIEVTVHANCTNCDLAVLDARDFQSDHIAQLCNEVPVVETEFATYGYPQTKEGQLVGAKIEGAISRWILQEHQHDVVLDPKGIVLVKEYNGFSGSGVINSQKQVTSILRYKDVNSLGSTSIRKAQTFLAGNGIAIVEDQLSDFSNFLPVAFEAVADPFKSLGLAEAKVVAGSTSPQAIVSSLTGKLMMPPKMGSLTDIIAFLKTKTVLNNDLWKGWLEFLACLRFLGGNYANIDAITVKLPGVQVSKFIEGVETNITQDIELTLQFFFTEAKEYVTIARQYLLDHSAAGTLKHHHCHVFHSSTPMFGLQAFTREHKKNIVFNISNPQDAGPQIVGGMDYGVLSFSTFATEVYKSQTREEAKQYLIQTLTDAIR